MAPGSDGQQASKRKENPSWLGKNVGMPYASNLRQFHQNMMINQ